MNTKILLLAFVLAATASAAEAKPLVTGGNQQYSHIIRRLVTGGPLPYSLEELWNPACWFRWQRAFGTCETP